MESGKRSKNFSEREKMLLLEIAKGFAAIIDNKKTDATSVDAKKQAWAQLTQKYNFASETGPRSEKQLHALYDNLKKKARRNNSDDKVSTEANGVENQKQMNEDAIMTKRLEILELQYQQEIMKLEKNKIIMDLDIELKKVQLENARIDIELKKNKLL